MKSDLIQANEWISTKDLAELARLVGDPSIPKTKRGIEKALEKFLTKKRLIRRNDKGRRAFEHHRESLPQGYQRLITEAYKLIHLTAAGCAEPTQAGTPLPAHDCAATQPGGFSGTALPCGLLPPGVDVERRLSGSADPFSPADAGTFLTEKPEIKAGMIMHTVQDDNRENRNKIAQWRLKVITPILNMEPRAKGRREKAENIAEAHGISTATLYRWIDDYKKGGLVALVDKHRADLGQARVLVSAQFERVMTGLRIPRDQIISLSEELMQLVRSLWAAGGTSPKQIWGTAIAKLGLKMIEAGIDETSARAIGKIKFPKRFVEAEKQFRFIGIAERDGKAVYDHHLPAVARTREGLLPGDLVFGDVSPLDIPTLRPDGSIAYARMICWMDAAINWMFVTLYLCPPGTGVRQEHVALSFTSLCESSPFGMAMRLYLDNGSEYQWEDMLNAWKELAYLTGSKTHVELASMLPPAGKIVRSIPFRPRGKLIEGAFGNLRHLFGWHPAFQGGNRMAKRCANLGEAIKPIPYEELQAFIAAAMADYHATEQGGHLNGKSPQEALDMHLNNGWKPVRVDREVLLLAFAEQEKRSVRAGIINYAGREWYADFLVGLDQKVDVRYPKHDPQCLFVFDNGKFLGAALPEHKYGLLDNAGSVEAGRRRGVLNKVIENMAGQVQTIDVADVIGSRGKLMGVDETVERAQQAATQVELSDEAKALIAAKKKALEQRAEAALVEAAKKTDHTQIKRWNVDDDPEDAIWRAKYG